HTISTLFPYTPLFRSRILSGLERRIGFVADVEITLEANPGTFEQDKFRDYRSLGINRLSIGVQSFQGDKLKALGRIHDGDEAIRDRKSTRLNSSHVKI